MRSFVTGSRAYGTPNKNSDPGTTGRDEGLSASIRFGVLNVIATTCPIAFAVWQKGTEELKRERPVGKEAAIRHFRGLRVLHGLKDLKDAK